MVVLNTTCGARSYGRCGQEDKAGLIARIRRISFLSAQDRKGWINAIKATQGIIASQDGPCNRGREGDPCEAQLHAGHLYTADN